MKKIFIHIYAMLILFFFCLIVINSVSAESSIVFQDGTPASGNMNYTIEETSGQRAGNNLFHSFQQFNLLKNESATFTGDNSIQNVINRITGGASSINGSIFSEIESANFYFINPAGIMFGPEARINIDGSFHVSTADYIRGTDTEKKFDMTSGEPIIFTDTPAAFGFLDKESYGSIQFDGFGEMDQEAWDNLGGGTTGLSVKSGKTISLIGGDVYFSQGSYYESNNAGSISTIGGRVNIASVVSEGEVFLQESPDGIQGLALGEITADTLGTIQMNEKTQISVDSQDQSGEIIIKGGQIFLENSSLSSKNYGEKQGGNIVIQGKNIILTNETTITTDNAGTGNGGNIFLAGQDGTASYADTATLIRSNLRAGTIPTGNDGDSGNAGNVSITAKKISLLSSYRLNPTVFDNDQIPDDIKQKLHEIDRTYPSQSNFLGELQNKLQGDYSLYLPHISTTYIGSTIDTGTSGKGTGGNISLLANEVIAIEGKSTLLSNSNFSGEHAGNAGNILINTPILSLSGAIETEGEEAGTPVGGISSETTGDGSGGMITIDADFITIAEFSFIKTNTTGSGNGGNVELNAETNISLLHGGMIEASSGGAGKTGSITLFTPKGTVQISGKDTDGDSSSIRSRCLSAGNGNEINIYAKSISLIYGGFIGSETIGTGNGGNVVLNAIEKIHFMGTDNTGYASKILTTSDNNSENAGTSGNIELSASNILFEDGAGVTASTLAAGDGGTVRVTGDIITLRGANPHGENIDGIASGIFARSESKGENAGDANMVVVNAKQLFIEDGAVISTSTLGAGKAGDLILNITEKLSIKGKRNETPSGTPLQSQTNYLDDLDTDYASGVFSRSQNPEPYAGDAGTITISADNDAEIRPSTPFIELDTYASISTATNGKGKAGNVDIYVEKLSVKGGASISSESFSTSVYFYNDSDFDGKVKMEMNRINFRIFTINMTPQENQYVPGIEYIDLIAENGDIGKMVVDDGNTKEITYYIYNDATGWTQDSKGLTTETPDPGQLKNSFTDLNTVPFYNDTNKKSIAQCQYVDVDIAIVQGSDGTKITYTMDKGDTYNYAFNGTDWQQLEQAGNISEILQKMGSSAEFVSIEDYVIKNNRTTSVQKSFYDGSQWLPLQSGGDAGTITIKNTNPGITGQLVLSGMPANNDGNTRISTATEGGGNAGLISIQLQQLQLTDKAEISSASNSQGDGGDAGSIRLGNNDYVIQLLNTESGAKISTSTNGLGDAGNIEIHSNQISLKSTGTIASSSNALGKSGNAGTILIISDTITLIDPGTIVNTSTNGQGAAGNIFLSVNNLSLDQKASISSASNSIGKGGDAGKITIGQTIKTDNQGELAMTDASNKIFLNNDSTISTSSAGAGKAGNVTLKANQIDIHQSSSVSSANSSVAEIIYTVDSLTDRNNLTPKIGMVVEVADTGNGNAQTYIYTGLSWEAKNRLSLNRVDTLDALNTITATPGDIAKVTDAGEGFSKNFIYTGQNWVEIVSDKTVQVYVVNTIEERDTIEPEKGDVVEIVNAQGDLLETYTFDSKNWVATQWTTLLDGQTAKAFQVNSLDKISLQRINNGDRADVFTNDQVNSLDNISLQRIKIEGRADVATNDQVDHYIYAGNAWKPISKAGDAGKIDIYAKNEVKLYTGGSLNTEAISSGGGQISIHGERSLYLFNGLITASVQKGFGKGGDITTQSKSVLMNHSGIEANAVEGDGGAIFITTEQYIKSDESSVTATSERGNDGTVKIDAPKVDISKGLVILPTNFLDATRWVKTPCALRSGESVSRLVVEGRDAVPTSLVDWQPSPSSDFTESGNSSKNKKSSRLNRPTLLGPNNKLAM
ncbi:MAG: filamentous hemagglutinin N-terminal domain-containing protein [Candidatus Magnetomorum sp.]|nr:filamentous hemagglutinin N-terminal domain-containing protein [Candidatus Magnetomorum sp.]